MFVEHPAPTICLSIRMVFLYQLSLKLLAIIVVRDMLISSSQDLQSFLYAPKGLWEAYSEALPGVLGNRRNGIYFRGTGEQRPNFEGNRGTKTILENR